MRRATAPRRASAVLCWSHAHYYSLQPLPKQPAVVRVFSAERPRHAPSSEPRRLTIAAAAAATATATAATAATAVTAAAVCTSKGSRHKSCVVVRFLQKTELLRTAG